MKFLFAVLILATQTAYAAPQDFTGSYQFSDAVVEQVKAVEVLHVGFEEGRRRMEYLRTQNYICEPKPSMNYLCYSFLSFDPQDPQIVGRVRARLRDATLRFFGPAYPPQLVTKGPDYVEWIIKQSVMFNGRTWPEYRYIESQGMARIFLGERAEETFLVTDRGIEYPVLSSISFTDRSWWQYFAMGIFTKN